MDFLLNDRSLAGQFPDADSFHCAVDGIMKIRQEVLRCGSALYCHRNVSYARVIGDLVMPQAIQYLPLPKRLAWIQWLTKTGPYWEDLRQHAANDWLEVDGDVVTDSAVGEAAVCRLNGLWRELVSFTPSDWLFTPVNVTHKRDSNADMMIAVANHWELGSVKNCLAAHPPHIDSWIQLERYAKQAYSCLVFAGDAFCPLSGHPFFPCASDRIRALLHVLNGLKGGFNKDGQRSEAGDRLYRDHFVGDKPWFTDSSEGEKNEFEKRLTFRHPESPGRSLFCPWHGKVNTPKLRVHFSWPIDAKAPLYVVYVGPKLTRR